MDDLIEKIHEILGTMDYPELRDLKTRRILLLIASELSRVGKMMSSVNYEDSCLIILEEINKLISYDKY